MDGYLDILRGKQDGGELDDGRFWLTGDEESGVNTGWSMIERQ